MGKRFLKIEEEGKPISSEEGFLSEVAPAFSLAKKLVDPTPAPTLTIDELDGDTDQIFLVIGKIIGSADGLRVYLRMNGDEGSNYRWVNHIGVTDGGHAVNVNDADDKISLMYDFVGEGLPADGFLAFDLLIHAKSGTNRRVRGKSTVEQYSTKFSIQDIGGVWHNSADNLTSLVFVASTGNIGGAGTFIRVYRLTD